MADTSTGSAPDAPAPSAVSPGSPPEEVFATPHFPIPERLVDYREPPLGIPPLITDSPALRAALGGPPLEMMYVGRPGESQPEAAPAPPPRPTLAEAVTSTFSGAPAGDAELRAQIAAVRAALTPVIEAITTAERVLPELLDALKAFPSKARQAEYFRLSEATEFYQRLTAALAAIRRKA